ncbi:MAG: hypothetical protein MUF18_02115 [Fimbriiglobus sp.]|nr:hypothetical protein [Fimbriiglobus sp.]
MTPQRALAEYEHGRTTETEAVIDLCRLATEYAPATFAQLMPAEWLTDIRKQTELLPDVRRWFRPGMTAAEVSRGTERYIAGLRAWKAYFDDQAAQG